MYVDIYIYMCIYIYNSFVTPSGHEFLQTRPPFRCGPEQWPQNASIACFSRDWCNPTAEWSKAPSHSSGISSRFRCTKRNRILILVGLNWIHIPDHPRMYLAINHDYIIIVHNS